MSEWKPKRTVLQVDSYSGELVFRFGKWRVDQFRAMDLLTNTGRRRADGSIIWADQTTIKVFRGGAMLSEGELVHSQCERSLAGYVQGLRNVNVPQDQRSYGVVWTDFVPAVWFEVGDEIHLSVLSRDVRRFIIDRMYESFKELPQWEDERQRLRAAANRLLWQKRRSYRGQERAICTLNRLHGLAFRHISIPDIIRFR